MKNLFSFLILLALLATGCSDDEGKIVNISLSENTQTTYTVYADQISVDEGITFTALADWTATVTAMTRATEDSSVDWLTLSTYSGGAGTYTLTLTLTENTTGQDRTACIEIICGSNAIVITIEQKAVTSDGQVVENNGIRLTRVEYSDTSEEKRIITLAYDSQGYISEMHDYDGEEEYEYTKDICHTFTYQDGQMYIVKGTYRLNYTTEYEEYVATFDTEGRVVSIYEKPSSSSSSTDIWKFEYDEDGYLQYIKENYTYYPDEDKYDDYENSHIEWSMEWENGNLMTTYDYNNNQILKEEYTSYTNDTPGFDFNAMVRSIFDISSDGYTEITNTLYMLRLLGNNSNNLTMYDENNYSYISVIDPDGEIPPTNTEYNESYEPFEYTFTADNYLQSATARLVKKTTVIETATGNVLEESVSYKDGEYLFTYE